MMALFILLFLHVSYEDSLPNPCNLVKHAEHMIMTSDNGQCWGVEEHLLTPDSINVKG